MKPKGKITVLAQHIIDTFRTLYSEEGISGREFSRRITEGSNPTRVAGFENIYNNESYTPEFTKKALNYFGVTMQDILPDELLDDDQLVEKTRIPILKKMSVKAALNSLLEEGYFDTPRLRAEITTYYNSFLPQENHKKDSDFSAQLEDLYNEGKLLKVQMADEDKKKAKLIRFVRNMELKED
ncbi:hypothetical protein ORI89_06345 [Sphingobacterium sp. UT-1RO-CII-1]|uniref:hypothetical protein n=1 Tax=Sphingobacterium sp. UT-1RO-CII-1 TaxID=2995225 RepID=UPI00227B0D7D|nr:hypothetical protein [Sphingobacterium sp. UT-1RO-CII-1]MCY4779262.1 hypothetical protein [Sphingobacterium sp. UT-1RO-CII-1]